MTWTPELSAVMVAGTGRKMAQHILDGLCAQTAADRMEIVVVDQAAETHPPLSASGPARLVYAACPENAAWGAARHVGVRLASAPVVAFSEDHCLPEPQWAEMLIEAHRGPWAAVGYAFTNANPATYISRSAMLADYGLWEHPTQHGPSAAMQSNNISYKREILLEFGDRLQRLLMSDCVIQEHLRKRGLPMFVESRAKSAHYNFTNIPGMLEETFTHSRTIAAVRAEADGWSAAKRVVRGLGTPVVAPVIRFGRLMRSFEGRPEFWGYFVKSLPILVISYAGSAMGEAFGYLFGLGDAANQLNDALLGKSPNSSYENR